MRNSLLSSRQNQLSRSNLKKRWRFSFPVLVCWLLALLTLAPPALAAKRSPTFTSPQIQQLEQQLKKQIHIKHTGKKASAVPGATPTILRPQTGGLPAYNNIGISDANTRSSANLDTSHRSYSASTLQDAGFVPGITITRQTISYLWPAVATGTADNYQAAGQVIPVTATQGDATVGFLGTATNGATSGTATLTYTNSTTTTFTLGLTDWWSSTISFSNEQAANVPTINTKGGTKTQTGGFFLYATTTPLNTSKTLQSVTLPTTSSPGQLHIFAVGVGGPAYNNTGITDNSSPGAGNFDTNGHTYSAQDLAGADLSPNQPFADDGISFTWPDVSSGVADNYQANGQILPIVPVPNATTLGFLGAATYGPSSGTATMTFSDASTQTFTIGFPDWGQSTLSFGDTIAATTTHRNSSSGSATQTSYLFMGEATIPTGKTLQTVTLPSTVSSGQLHVFALSTRSTLNNLGTSNDSQSGGGNYDGSNRSWSVQSLAAAGLIQGQPFIFNGVSFPWPASYGSLADNSQATGQVIPVTPVPNATTLAFLGSGSNGSPTGTATITYTDSTTTPFTLGMTDWWSATASNGNLIATTLSTINIPGGTRAGTYHLFYAETSLTSGKTIQSVTLSATVSSGQMHLFSVSTRSDYNNIGISDVSQTKGANFDGQVHSYSAEDFANPNVAGWNPGDTLTYEGIDYIWPDVAAGQADNYQANGQTIAVTPVSGATTIGFVGSASNGGDAGSTGTVTLHYTDSTTSTITLGMTDWAMHGGSATPVTGNRLFAILPTRNAPQGSQSVSTFLFESEFSLTVGKTLSSVTFPASVSQGQLHVFMLGTRASNAYPTTVGTSDDSDTVFANYDGAGNSYSIEALETAGVNEGQPFTFNGVTFNWPASYSVIPDDYQAAGQVLPVTPVGGATTLAFLGSAANSSTTSSGTATITYTDNSTQPFTLTLTNWWNGSAAGGNLVAATCSYLNTSTGTQTGTYLLFYTDVTLQAGKTIQSVTLPSTVSSGQLHIFAISTK